MGQIILGIVIALIIIVLYVYRAYNNRISDQRLTYLIKSHYHINGRVAKKVENIVTTPNQVTATITYFATSDKAQKRITETKIFTLKPDCGYDNDCLMV